MKPYYGVYRVKPNGQLVYVSRSVTNNRKLAQDITSGLSDGEIVMPDGSIKRVLARPHVVKEIT